MRADRFAAALGAEFFAGVPDSLLRPFCDYLTEQYGLGSRHIIAANEGNAVGLAAGHYLATGKPGVVYLQNSGLGNIVNPVASLLNEKVYGIPVIFVVGWRGEPGVHDEPQHVFQGEITEQLLRDIGLETFVVSPDTSDAEMTRQKEIFDGVLSRGRSVAWLVCKGALEATAKYTPQNPGSMKREEVLRRILDVSGEDIIVSTTGKTSRELFELREQRGEGHYRDFLTVGSMGHSSSIALGIALRKPDRRVWCVDGDGAALMHLGAMATIGAHGPENLVHVVVNNGAHESVGGLPTVAGGLDMAELAECLGYPAAYTADSPEALAAALERIAKTMRLTFLEVKSAVGSRPNLGRPTTSPEQNKSDFMFFLGNAQG